MISSDGQFSSIISATTFIAFGPRPDKSNLQGQGVSIAMVVSTLAFGSRGVKFNPSGGDKMSSFVVKSRSYDCHKPLN